MKDNGKTCARLFNNSRSLAFLWILVCSLFVVPVTTTASARRLRDGRSTQVKENELLCHISRAFVSAEDDVDWDMYVCEILDANTQNDIIEIIFDHIHSNTIDPYVDNGDLILRIQGAILSYSSVDTFKTVPIQAIVQESASIEILDSKKWLDRRHLNDAGSHKVIILRISTNDSAVVLTDDEIADAFYAADKFSVVTHAASCSASKISFTPFRKEFPVLDVYVPGNSSSYSPLSLFSAANIVASKDIFGGKLSDYAQHSVFCLPPGLDQRLLAMSAVNGWFTIAGNKWCGNPAAMIHEFGHNLGLGHAGENGNEYADTTSLMGYGQVRNDGPLRCFNGYQYNQLGWFIDQTTRIQSTSVVSKAKLAAFTDHTRVNSRQSILVIVSNQYFLIYNRKESFNNETGEYPDMITITIKNGIRSSLIGVLSMTNPTFSIPDGSTIQVCSKFDSDGYGADYYTVAVGPNGTPCAAVNFDFEYPLVSSSQIFPPTDDSATQGGTLLSQETQAYNSDGQVSQNTNSNVWGEVPVSNPPEVNSAAPITGGTTDDFNASNKNSGNIPRVVLPICVVGGVVLITALLGFSYRRWVVLKSSTKPARSSTVPSLQEEYDLQKVVQAYPRSVRELVMNGYSLNQVLHAYEAVGEKFDDMLSFILSSSENSEQP